jgi:hypothetical protein
MMRQAGFVNVGVRPPLDVFGEAKACTFVVYGYAFLGHKPL